MGPYTAACVAYGPTPKSSPADYSLYRSLLSDYSAYSVYTCRDCRDISKTNLLYIRHKSYYVVRTNIRFVSRSPYVHACICNNIAYATVAMACYYCNRYCMSMLQDYPRSFGGEGTYFASSDNSWSRWIFTSIGCTVCLQTGHRITVWPSEFTIHRLTENIDTIFKLGLYIRPT